MKRITAFTALIVLMFMAAFGTYAAETDGQMEIIHNHENSASSTVVYGIDEAYIATVPAAIDLKLGQTHEYEVTLTGVYLPLAKSVNISVSSENYNTAKSLWDVVLDTDADVRIPYSIKIGANPVASGDRILTCNGGDNEESVILTLRVEEDPVQSGSYLDTLTFSVTIDDKN